MAPSQKDFVRAVMDELGINQTDLGRLLKLPHPYQDAHRLLRGRGRRLSYDDTMLLLEKCGWLNMNATPQSSDGQATVTGAPLAEIAGSLRDLLTGQQKLLDRIGRAPTNAQPEPPQVASTRKPKK